MLVFFCITIMVLTLFAITFRVGVVSEINLLDGCGFFVIYFFLLPIYRGKIHFEHLDMAHNNLIIEHGKKADEIHLNVDKKDKKSIASVLSVPYFSNLVIENLSLDFYIGKNNDAFTTTMLMGGVKILLYSVISLIKSRHNVKVQENFFPEYNSDILHLDAFGIISISIADIIYSILQNIKISERTKKMEVKQL